MNIEDFVRVVRDLVEIVESWYDIRRRFPQAPAFEDRIMEIFVMTISALAQEYRFRDARERREEEE